MPELQVLHIKAEFSFLGQPITEYRYLMNKH
jgi:hypothetical protein